MSDQKTIRERLGIIGHEGQLLLRDLAGYGFTVGRWAFRQASRQLGIGPGSSVADQGAAGRAEVGPEAMERETLREEAPRKPAPEPEQATEGSTVSEEGYRPGQVWRPADTNKTARKITQVYEEGGAVYLIWEPPEGGKSSRIQESSFTRWARREEAELEEGE